MLAKLVRRGWLHRGIELTLPDGRHVVEYDGRGAGYEQVSVDGGVIRLTGWIWFVPRFEFKLGDDPQFSKSKFGPGSRFGRWHSKSVMR